MGERKGVNKYYPPDFDPQKHRSLDKYHNTHPLRERAKKIHLGILVIRYEMPYNVWCEGCGNHIGMGVRYNAEKKKVGNYYTTPIYQFKMKCHLCDNYLVMETDPKNCEYKCISGVRRKNQKWDMEENEQVVPEDKEELKKRAVDSMNRLEHGVNDKKKSTLVMPTLGQLAERQSGWRDDYEQNSMLRKIFRTEKKKVEANKVADAKLLTKSSLNIELVAETDEDRELAGLLKYSVVQTFDEKQKQKREEIQSKPIFSSSKSEQRKTSEKSTVRSENIVEKLGNKVLKSVSDISFGTVNKKRHHKMLDIGVRKKKTKICDGTENSLKDLETISAITNEVDKYEQEIGKDSLQDVRKENDLEKFEGSNSTMCEHENRVSQNSLPDLSKEKDLKTFELSNCTVYEDKQNSTLDCSLQREDRESTMWETSVESEDRISSRSLQNEVHDEPNMQSVNSVGSLQNAMGILCDYGSSSGEEG